MAHAEPRTAGAEKARGRRKKTTKELKWMAAALQLDQQHQEGDRFKKQAEDAALHWATLTKDELSSPETIREAFSLAEACRDNIKRGILAEEFREAADACDGERAKSMRALADKISSGHRITVNDFTRGF